MSIYSCLFFSLIGEKKKSLFKKLRASVSWSNNLAFLLCPFRLHAPNLIFVFYPRDSSVECVKHPEERTLTRCPCCLAQVSRACNRDGLWMPFVLQVSLDPLPGMEGESLLSPFCAKMKSKWCSEKPRGASRQKFLRAWCWKHEVFFCTLQWPEAMLPLKM